MRRPPRAADTPLLTRGRLAAAGLQGLVLLAGAFGAHVALLGAGLDPSASRAAAFLFLVAANLGVASVLAAAGRAADGRQRLAFAAIAALAGGGVIAALLVAPLAALFAFSAPPAGLGLAAAGLGFGAGVAVGWAGRLGLRAAP